eukprot:jgi/Mesen1/7223/ME000372S06466
MGDEGKFLNFVTEKEVLKEQKEKKEAEFNERFRNLPPKALDDDETEFLDACAKRKQERKEHNEKEKVRATTAKRAAAPPPIIIRVQPKRARGETTSLSGKKSIQQQGGLAPPKPSIEQAVAAGGLAGLASYDSEEDNDE